MTPETRSFLASVRHAEDPTRDDEQRVLAAVRLAAVGGVVAGVAASGGRVVKWFSGASALKGTTVVLACIAASELVGPTRKQIPEAVAISRQHALPARRPEKSVPAPVSSSSEVGTLVPPRAAGARPLRPAPVEPLPATLAAATPERAPSAGAELAVLAEAQAALRAGDGAATLRTLDSHATRDARFLAERRALRILALCAAGRVLEARREADAFRKSDPTSIQRTSIARSCAGEVER